MNEMDDIKRAIRDVKSSLAGESARLDSKIESSHADLRELLIHLTVGVTDGFQQILERLDRLEQSG